MDMCLTRTVHILKTDRKQALAFEHDELTYRINGRGHCGSPQELGAGPVFESIYENSLCIELDRREICFERQKRFHVQYDGEDVGELIADLVVEEKVIVELKSVKELLPIHEAQVIAYLRAARLRTGLLINFNVVSLKSGVRRISV